MKSILYLKKIHQKFLSILFPLHCIICGKEGWNFCVRCREKIPLLGGFNHAGIFSLWGYEHADVRSAIVSLKYKNKRMISSDIADSLYDVLLEHLAEKSVFTHPCISEKEKMSYLLVPIPLSNKRLRKRGYNQAELLAKELSQRNPEFFVIVTDVLYKIKDIRTQVSVKDRTRRLENMRGTFGIKNPKKIWGRDIILIDDVTTTGATLNEARKMLLKSGAKAVYGVTVAH